jgi:DNA adenine methylase
MYSNKLYTPLRYPGGKARFAPLIAEVMHANKLNGGHYFEPYAGGAGVALLLLFDGEVDQVHINDADPAVAVFWRAVTKYAAEMIDMVAGEPVTMDAWNHWRSIMLGYTPASGILMGGVIGGKEQSGTYKLNARFMRDELCSRLERIGRHAGAIHVYEEDAHALLLRCHQFLPMRSLVYLDPPYYVKGSGLYRNFYAHNDHARLAKLLGSARFRRPWIVSYDNAEEIRAMYEYAQAFNYGLHYTAQRRYVGAEVMFFSERLSPPVEVHIRKAA